MYLITARLRVAAIFGTALCFGFGVSASALSQPAPDPTRGAPEVAPSAPPPALAPQLPPDSEEARLLRKIQRTERAAFEHGAVKEYLALLTDDVTRTTGRIRKPGPYDVTLNRATLSQILDFEARDSDDPNRTLFFNHRAVDLKETEATVTLHIGRQFFGGNDVFGQHYHLIRSGKDWKIKSIRRWPLRQSYGPESIAYDESFWVEADEEVKKAEEETKDHPPIEALNQRLVQYVRAYRFKDALAVTTAATEAHPDTAEVWLHHAEMSLAMGKIDEARAAVERARALNPTLRPPAFFQPDPRKARARKVPPRAASKRPIPKKKR